MLTFSDHLVELIQAPYSAIWASNADEHQTPDLARLSGARVEPEKRQLLMFASLKFGSTFLKNIQQSRQLSFLCASVLTLESYQLKGSYITHRPCTPEEVDYQRQYMSDFCTYIASMVASNAGILDSFFHQPSVAVCMEVEELFEQTPRRGTGQKLSTI